MIDKKRVGKYLKSLRLEKKRERDGKSFSQDDLSNEMNISINAIAEWKSGASLPSYEKLEQLSKIFNKSIDELLDGESRINVDYSNKYFTSNTYWYMDSKYKDNSCQIRNEQINLITKTFKKLLMTRVKRLLTANEEEEFKFLFNNFYSLSNYAKNYAKELSDINSNDDYLKFKYTLDDTLSKMKSKSSNEKYWEIQKLFSENKYLWFTFRSDVHDLRYLNILKERFKNIENWQKDMLLAMFQNIEPSNSNPEKYGSNYLKKYEETLGESNHELNVKSIIKDLINRGACINPFFLNVYKEELVTHRIIDRMQELYDLCLKPIEIQIMDENNKQKCYLIENNLKNRFITNYYLNLELQLKTFRHSNNRFDNFEKIYNWFINNDEIPDNTYKEIAKDLGLDTSQNKKYWLSDAKNQNSIEKYFKEYKNTEGKISNGLIELHELKSKLDKGETVYTEKKLHIIGGNDEESIRKYIEYWKTKIDYSTYIESRDFKLTTELLNNIDSLSLKEIKDKYFKMEVIRDE